MGRAGFVLKQWLLQAVPLLKLAWERSAITIMNTLRCLPPEIQGRAYPRGQERLDAETYCRQYDSIPESIHTVILFGESPQRCWFREELEVEDAIDRQLQHQLKGVMGRIGRVYTRDGKRWVFAPHPAFILRQPALVQHGQEAMRVAVGTEQLAEPAYLPWEHAMRDLL